LIKKRIRGLIYLTVLLITAATAFTTGTVDVSEPSEVEEYLVLYEKGFVEEAITGLKSEKSARPEDIRPPFYLGYIYGDLKVYKEAAAEFRNCLEINPDLPDVHYNLGTALNGLGEYEEATREFQEALLLDPGYVDAMYNCGVSYYYSGKYIEAIKMYKEAEELELGAYDIAFNLAVAYEELDPVVAMRMWENYVDSIEDDESARPYYDAAIKRMERLRERTPGP
jgi:tetratricopeptide (TPR) repeat protein